MFRVVGKVRFPRTTYYLYKLEFQMNWTYKGTEVITSPDNAVGFVYIIECLVNGKKYIGKKLFLHTKTKVKTVTLKNGTKKKKKIREKIDSDWMQYFGSSIELSNDVETLGKENFKREILHFCTSKAMCSYLEAKYQFSYGVLESDDWYNGWISVKVHKGHIKNNC